VSASREPRKLVLAGDSKLAEMAFEYFSRDSPYEIVAFAVEQEYLRRDSLFGLPVVRFETVEERYDPAEHDLHVAVAYRLLNRVRARLVAEAKSKGYRLASYLSSNARVWPDVQLGEHHFIIEENVIQPFVRIGNNVVIMGPTASATTRPSGTTASSRPTSSWPGRSSWERTASSASIRRWSTTSRSAGTAGSVPTW